MRVNLPHQVRAALYILTGLAGPVMVYLLAKGYIGTLEMALFSSEVAFVNIMAALNVTNPSTPTEEEDNTDVPL